MFALGALLLIAVFLAAIILLSLLLPRGRWRWGFVVGVIGAVLVYPFLYLISPSYTRFKDLCSQPRGVTVVKAKQIDYLFLNWGFTSDCTEGPELIGASGFAGFDCLMREKGEGVARLYRFRKNANAGESCGLECFDREVIAAPEARYRSQDRYGYIDGDKVVITNDGATYKTDIPNTEKLRFRDLRLMDEAEGEMAFSRHYYFHPYGAGWAKVLGMASGDPPTERCSPDLLMIDPRDVYKPRGNS